MLAWGAPVPLFRTSQANWSEARPALRRGFAARSGEDFGGYAPVEPFEIVNSFQPGGADCERRFLAFQRQMRRHGARHYNLFVRRQHQHFYRGAIP